MNSSEFDDIIDNTLLQIEDAIEDAEVDIDFDTIAGILTLEFSNASKIIINRQIATKQLWLAAKSGGFHFDYVDGLWLDERDQCDLQTRLNHLATEQADETITLSLHN